MSVMASLKLSLALGAGLWLTSAPAAIANNLLGPNLGSMKQEAIVVPEPESDLISVNTRTGKITTSQELQALVNTEAVEIATRLRSGRVDSATLDGESAILPQNTQEAIVNLLIAGETETSPQIEVLREEIAFTGVLPDAQQDLFAALAGMFRDSLDSSSSAGDSVDGAIPQGEFIVNLNKLSDAIVAYNDIVMSSSPEDLQLLGNDPEFLVIGQILRELRETFREPSEDSSS